jgi:hypothetical protein
VYITLAWANPQTWSAYPMNNAGLFTSSEMFVFSPWQLLTLRMIRRMAGTGYEFVKGVEVMTMKGEEDSHWHLTKKDNGNGLSCGSTHRDADTGSKLQPSFSTRDLIQHTLIHDHYKAFSAER